jgi:hypothetical protein
VRKVAFITLLCEKYDEKADVEIEQISNILKRLKKWKPEKITVLPEV